MVVILEEEPQAATQAPCWREPSLAPCFPFDGHASIWNWLLSFRQTTGSAAKAARPPRLQTPVLQLYRSIFRPTDDTQAPRCGFKELSKSATWPDAAVASEGCLRPGETPWIGECEDVAMDVQIWSSLPQDIIEKVLTWLPLTSVIRFRSVCRHWNSVLLSGSFLSSHSKISLHRQPLFLLCTIGRFACAYDPSLGKWLTLLKPSSPGASVIASTGSLLCLGNQVAECSVLSICNPITHAVRHLPAMHKLRLIHKITMVEDHSTNSYTIVVAGEDGFPAPYPHNFNLTTEVFDSQVNAWHAAGDPPSDAKFGSDPGVWLEGAFYCLTEQPFGIVKFSLERGMWEDLSVLMPTSLSGPSLVIVRNRLMMVGKRKTCSQAEAAFTIHVWELTQRPKRMGKPEADFNSNEQDGIAIFADNKENTGIVCCGDLYEWIEVLEVPESIIKEFLAHLVLKTPFVCVGVGSSIFMTTYLSPSVLVLDCSLAAMSNSGHCYSWLPRDPLFPTHRDSHLLGFSFEPRFSATP